MSEMKEESAFEQSKWLTDELNEMLIQNLTI